MFITLKAAAQQPGKLLKSLPPSLLPWWVGISALIGLLLSIPLVKGDLPATSWFVGLSQESLWIQWWNEVADRTVFQGGPPGAQDVTYFSITLILFAYFCSMAPLFGRMASRIRLFTGYYSACMLLFLVVNRGLKALFGRARPLDVLCGNQDYSSIWLIGPYGFSEAVSKGSFTSGHTTAGMFLLPLVFLLAHSSRRYLVWAVLVLAVSWGALIGVGRVFRGSHYPGDVLWAMITCLWICAFAAYRLFGLDRRGQSPAMPSCWELRLTIWSALTLFALFAAVIGIKQMVFEPTWYWPLVLGVSTLLAWTGSIKTGRLARC
jgi:membrane-associated phospholipid phosphatase